MNSLTALLKASPKPSVEQLATVFQEYEKKQRGRAGLVVNFSGFQTRLEAQANWFYRVLWKGILLRLPDWLLARLMIKGIYQNAACMEFLPHAAGIIRGGKSTSH